MDKAKIAKLCNEIEDFTCDISQQTMNDIVSAESRMIFDKAKEISAEITTPPKTNADRIRQMTDEELADWLAEHGNCRVCAWYRKECVKHVTCKRGVAEWLKQEVQNNDG